jgi:hypothetical protein
MKSGKMALKIAIDLLHVPSQVRFARLEPLPDGVLLLLRIAAGVVEAERMATATSGRSLETVRRSAAFFIEQILFAPNADSYRVLGANAQASSAELRRNVVLLMKWLRPDLDVGGARSAFVRKVTAAWNNLKTEERRAAYDAQRRLASEQKFARSGSSGHSRKRQIAVAIAHRRARDRDEIEQWLGHLFRRALSRLLHRPG